MVAAVLEFETPRLAAEACGRRTLELLEAAVRFRGIAYLAVSGGNTPRMMFDWMSRRDFDWSSVHIFWVDERCVDPDDVLSNYRMTRESLLDHIAVLPDQIHRVRSELPPDQAAARYVDEIQGVLGDQPVFDVIQRGMGNDSHTASLFPGEPLLADRDHIAASVWVAKLGQNRVTLLPGVLARARHTVCLVTGNEKREALDGVLNGPFDIRLRPAQIQSVATEWFVDEAAWPD